MFLVELSLRISRALLRFLLSIAEMSRFFPLRKVVNDADRGLVFNSGGGCMFTSVVASLSDPVKLLS